MAKTESPKFDKNLKFRLFTKEQRTFWRNLEINIEHYCDKWELYKEELSSQLTRFSTADFAIIKKVYSLTNSPDIPCILSNQKLAIELFCILQFSLINPKAISRIFDIPIVHGKVNRIEAFIKTIESYKKNTILDLYLLMEAFRTGTSRNVYTINFSNKKINLEELEKHVSNLTRYLNRHTTDFKEYHLRFSSKIGDDFYFLVLKETLDKVYPSIPDNTRIQAGRKVLIKIDTAKNRLNIGTQSKKESQTIKNYLSKKSGAIIQQARVVATYNPKKFFDSILRENVLSNDVKLVNAEFANTRIGNQIVTISDGHKKNDITHVIRWLYDQNVLALKDFSEFKSLSFSFSDILFAVRIVQDRWGRLRMFLADKRKPAIELNKFRLAFEKAFDIPFDSILKHENEALDQVTITRKLLDNKSIDANVPKDIEDTLLELIDKKYLKKPTKSVKRRCISCGTVYWTKGDCKICGNEGYFEGDQIEIDVEHSVFEKFVLSSLKKIKTLRVNKVNRQLQKRKYPFIEIIDEEGNFLSVYINKSNLPLPILDHFEGNGNSLLVILLKYREALTTQIRDKGFESTDFASIIFQSEGSIETVVRKAIQDQKIKWISKVISKGSQSFARIQAKNKNYSDQDFEKDVYNLLHQMFLIGDRLGGKFAGVKAPDGIISIQDYAKPMKRYCMAWDCKYSVHASGYSLREKPEKHRHYIRALSRNDKVIFFGSLKTYAIISQNMNLAKYEKFYQKLKDGWRWKGQVLFVTEDILLMIYSIFAANQELIASYPTVFYKRIFLLLLKAQKAESTPYLFVSRQRVLNAFERMKTEFQQKHRKFEFNRDEFK